MLSRLLAVVDFSPLRWELWCPVVSCWSRRQVKFCAVRVDTCVWLECVEAPVIQTGRLGFAPIKRLRLIGSQHCLVAEGGEGWPRCRHRD